MKENKHTLKGIPMLSCPLQKKTMWTSKRGDGMNRDDRIVSKERSGNPNILQDCENPRSSYIVTKIRHGDPDT